MKREKLAYDLGYRIINNEIVSPTGETIKGTVNKSGFHQFGITHKIGTIVVHRLLGYQKFGEKIYDNSMRVKHIDGNKLNNIESNIELVEWHGAKQVSLVGQKFGRLFVKEQIRDSQEQITFCKCICDCGKEIMVRHGNLKGGSTKSCGCLAIDLLVARAKPIKEVIAQNIYNYYKRNSGYRNIVFELTKQQVKDIIFSPCLYCGTEAGTTSKVNRLKKYGNELEKPNNGIDRFDNDIGYTLENSVSCCKDCNYAKHDMSFQAFKEWATRLVKHLQSIDREGGGRKLGERQQKRSTDKTSG